MAREYHVLRIENKKKSYTSIYVVYILIVWCFGMCEMHENSVCLFIEVWYFPCHIGVCVFRLCEHYENQKWWFFFSFMSNCSTLFVHAFYPFGGKFLNLKKFTKFQAIVIKFKIEFWTIYEIYFYQSNAMNVLFCG